MSVFIMKLLAMSSMIIDHLGAYLKSCHLIAEPSYTVLRSIGRFAFPVYCFLIVNGYQKTRDVKRYLTRLIAFAAVSQIPYTVFNNPSIVVLHGGLSFSLGERWFVCLILILVAGVGWYTAVRADGSVVWPVLALILAVLRVDYAGIHILGGKLNVFYTLALALASIAVLDSALKPDRDVIRLLMQALALFGAFFLIGDSADYGFLGVALILAIWIARGSMFSVAGVILLWCVVKHLVSGVEISRFIGAACSLVPILLYNGKKGPPLKLGFYAVYPLHLAILGAFVVYHILT